MSSSERIQITTDQIPVIVVCLAMIIQVYGVSSWCNYFYRKPILSGKRLKDAKEKLLGTKDTEGKAYFGIMGYPDFGNGRISDTLNYGDWYKFNAAIRCQMNFFELVGPAMFSTFILGLLAPKIAFLTGI